MEPTISRSVSVAADSALVWSIVTDLPEMGGFSPENVGGTWLAPWSELSVGARFRGVNRNGRKQWWTRVRVTECEVGRFFAFDVRSPFGMRVSRWAYQIEPSSDGCLLTEHWYRVGNAFVRMFLGPLVTGQRDRPRFNTYSIEQTLERVKKRAESAGFE